MSYCESAGDVHFWRKWKEPTQKPVLVDTPKINVSNGGQTCDFYMARKIFSYDFKSYHPWVITNMTSPSVLSELSANQNALHHVRKEFSVIIRDWLKTFFSILTTRWRKKAKIFYGGFSWDRTEYVYQFFWERNTWARFRKFGPRRVRTLSIVHMFNQPFSVTAN